MAVIYLKHPEHGVKVACLDLEAEADEENGWERFDPEQVTAPIDNAIVRRRPRNTKVNNEEVVNSSSNADFN